MNKTAVEKIKRFLSDKQMSESVKEVLTDSFLKSKGSRDIHIMAAERIALDLLKDGFKELETIAKIEEKSDKEMNQVGL